ncbi:hypothetical protein JL720_14212 [Aureococcus anophagefferens]|nr:hypothetical protein JL720_14212 [Aureococcus anophagefferens]
MWGYGSARLALRALTTRRLDRRDAALEELDAEPSSSRWAALRQRYDLGEELGPAAAAAPTAAELPREAQLLGEARHRAVLRVHECLPEDGFLVTERLDGGELFDRLARRELVGDARAQRKVLGDVFDAVAFLHDAGIAHLDLKPENIVLEDDEEWNVRLVDFGSARRVDGRDGRDGAVGIHDSPRTAAYAPPELLRRERGVDPKKVDAWAAGVVAYFVFTGRHPSTAADRRRPTASSAVLAGAEAAGRFEGADWARARGHARRRRALPEPDPPRRRSGARGRGVDQNPAPQHRLVLDRGEAARWVLDGGERARSGGWKRAGTAAGASASASAGSLASPSAASRRPPSAAATAAAAPRTGTRVYFEDNFDAGIGDKWVPSEWKDAESTGKWVHTAGEWYAEGQEAIAKGMQASEDMKFHSISAPLDSEATTVGKPLVIQFTVKHEKKDYAFCGGGYIKLLPGKVDAKAFGGDTPYSIMFGPDLCGYDISRVHLIFEHGGENLLKEEEIKLDYADKDEFTHLYTMVLEADGSYEVFFDQVSKASGKIVDDWAFPDAEVKDPAVSKPEDWVDTKKIPDPAAAKPEGYDDIPAEIPDPDGDARGLGRGRGRWEPPMIDNPEFKGEWKAPMIENPDYVGAWVHPMVANADYKPETYAKYSGLSTVGFELWTVNAGSIFDNILVTDDKAYADKAAEATWKSSRTATRGRQDALNEPGDDEDDAADDEDEHDWRGRAAAARWPRAPSPGHLRP